MPSASRLLASIVRCGTLTYERVDQLRATVDQVLAVVEEQQQPLVLEVLGESLDDWTAWLFHQAQHRHYCLRHETLVRERREFHQPDAIGKALE